MIELAHPRLSVVRQCAPVSNWPTAARARSSSFALAATETMQREATLPSSGATKARGRPASLHRFTEVES